MESPLQVALRQNNTEIARLLTAASICEGGKILIVIFTRNLLPIYWELYILHAILKYILQPQISNTSHSSRIIIFIGDHYDKGPEFCVIGLQ